MIKKKNNGQEAIEFVLISVLVFFGALFAILIFGDKIAAFFHSDSAAANTKTAQSIDASAESKYEPDYATELDSSKIKVGDIIVLQASDGTASFEVEGQTVTLTPDIIGLADTVLQTSGAGGLETLVAEISQMIVKNKALYPDSQVPVDVSFGTGERESVTFSNEFGNFSFSEKANTIAIQTGKSLTIIQKDQACIGDYCELAGEYRIEGDISDDGTFTGKVTSDVTYDGVNSGDYTASVDTTQGLELTGSIYHHANDYFTHDYKWDIFFTDPNTTFEL